MSYRTLSTKPLNASLKTLMKRGAHIGIGLGAFTPVLALANPTGGQVMGGQATIANPSANGTIITQKSQSAIINWQQFNIGSGQFVQFLQPSSSSVVLNRVIGGSASSILGSLTANGQVFLVNTNGVYFGKGASVDTQGFLASTLGITDQNFLSHNYVFDQAGAAGATVINQGSITSHHAGYVVLAGDYAENDGIISAQSGHVVLASGAKATLALNGNNLVNFAVNQSTLATYAGVKNAGSVLADGGTVIMTADVANLLKATVVNNTGLVEARAISDKGGVIFLNATGGDIQNAGTLDVSATRNGQAGGDITLKGDGRTTLTNTSNIDAAGQGGNGGSVEVSGNTISMRGAMKIGKGGKLLMDPGEMQIVLGTASSSLNSPGSATNTGSVGHVGVNFIQNQLNQGVGVTIQATHLIDASTHVHTITATTLKAPATQEGDLTLKTTGGPGSRINLSGVDINIGGKLTASMGYGTFGHLTAGVINLNAVGAIELPAATLTKGAVTTWSAKTTTGDLDINANQVVNETSSTTATLALSAKGQLGLSASYHGPSGAAEGNLILMGQSMRSHRTLFLDGKLTATASDGYADFGSITAKDGINITTTSGNVEAGNLTSSSGAGITVKAGGAIDAATVFANAGNVILTATGDVGASSLVAIKGAVTVNAGGALDLGHAGVDQTAVFAAKGLNVTAAHGIEYLGSGVFTLFGGTGDVVVHGAFGVDSAGEGGVGAGGLLLQTNGGKVQLDHSVLAYGGIAIQGASLAYTGAGSNFKLSAAGVLSLNAAIGTAKAPVAYGVTLKDNNGVVVLKRSIYTKDGISVIETGQSSTHFSHGVYIGNGDSTSITLSARGPITLAGARVDIGADQGSGRVAPITISADDGNSKTSTDKLSITASDGSIYIQPSGNAIFSGAVAKASLNHTITLHAGGDVDITATGQVSIRGAGGPGSPDSYGMRAFGLLANTSVAAIGDVDVTAGHDIEVQGTGVDIRAGLARAQVGGFSAGNDLAAVANATAAADVNFTAGHDIDITATAGSIDIAGGAAYGAANGAIKGQKATAKSSAVTTFTAGDNIDLTAVTDIAVTAGNRAGSGSGAFAFASNAVANVSLHTDVNMTAGNALSIKSGTIALVAGQSAGGAAIISRVGPSDSLIGAVGETDVLATSKNASANITVTSALDLNAGAGGLAVSASTAGLTVNGGDNAAMAIQLQAVATGAHVSDVINASVTLNSKGVTALHAATALHIRGGNDAGGGASSHQTSASGALLGLFLQSRLAGTAALTVNAGVNITAAQNLNITAQSASVSGGARAGDGLGISGSVSNAKATANLNADASLAAGDALSIKSHFVTLRAGQSAGGAYIHHFGASNASASLGDPASLVASAKAATAAVNVTSALNIAAGKGGMTLSGSGSLYIGGGLNAAAAIQMTGLGTAAHVSDTIDAAVTIVSKGGLTLKGGSGLNVRGGSAGRPVVSYYRSTSTGGSVTGHTTLNPSQIVGRGDTVINLSVDAGVTLTAVGAIKASASGGFTVEGGSDDGSDMDVSINPDGTKGSTKIALRGGVDVTAGASLSFEGKTISLEGGVDAGAGARITAIGGVLSLTDDDSLVVTGRSVSLQSANTHGSSMRIAAGNGGESMDVFASNAAKANVSIDTAAAITATKGNITLIGERFTASGGNSGGIGASISASNGANATLNQDAALSFKATGLLSADFGSIVIRGGNNGLEAAQVYANAGGAVASLTAEDSVSITAGSAKLTGRTVTLAGGTGGNASVSFSSPIPFPIMRNHVSVTALGKATATLKETGALNLAVTGALSISASDAASHAITLQGAGQSNGYGGSAFAHGAHAVASLTADGSLNIKAGSVKIAGNSGAGILVGSQGGGGRGATAVAFEAGNAAYTEKNAVSITAVRALSLDATGALNIVGGARAGSLADASATSAGVATVTGSDGVNLKGGSVSLSAADGIRILGGSDVAAPFFVGGGPSSDHARVSARGRSKATLTENVGVAITATTAFSALLTGSASSVGIQIGGGLDADSSAIVRAQAAGAAKMSVNAGVGINVIGATGTVDIDTGDANNTSFDILGGLNTGRGDRVTGSSGAASMNVAAGVTITAKGAVTLLTQDTTAQIGGQAGVGAYGLNTAVGTGGRATSNIGAAVNISGGTLTLTDASDVLVIHGGHHTGSGGSAVASGFSDQATGPATATTTVNAGVSLTANGNLDLNADNVVLGTAASNANLAISASVNGIFGGKASLTANAGVSVTGGNVTVQSRVMNLIAQTGAGANVSVQGGSNGGNAVLTANAGVSLKATGTLTLDVSKGIAMDGGGYTAVDADLTAFGTGAKATYTAQSAVSLSAKTVTITTTAAGSGGVYVDGGSYAIQDMGINAGSGGAVTASVASQVSITASGTLSVTAANGGSMQAGAGAANVGTLDADHGKVSLAVTSGTVFTAGGNMNLNFGDKPLIVLVGDAGSSQDINAGPGGAISETLNESVLLKSGAKLTLSNITGLTANSADFTHLPTVNTAGTGKVSGLFNGGISFLGTSVVSSNVTGFTHLGNTNFSSDGIVFDTGVTVTGGLSKLSFAPLSLGTLQQDALNMSLETVLAAPAQAATPVSFGPKADALSFGPGDCQALLLHGTGSCRTDR